MKKEENPGGPGIFTIGIIMIVVMVWVVLVEKRLKNIEQQIGVTNKVSIWK